MAKRTGLGRGVEAFYGGAGSTASEGKKAAETPKASDVKKTSETQKSSETKTVSDKGSSAKASVTKASDPKTGGTKSASTKTASSKSDAAKSTGTKSNDKKTADTKSAETKSTAAKAAAKTSVGKESTVDAPVAAKEKPSDGLHALDPRESDIVALVKHSKIEPNRDQPRKDFEEEGLQELAESISNHGLIQPILVRPVGDHYEIVAGERRWRAARLAGLRDVPVIIRKDYTDADVAEIALVENLQRKDLNPVEEALAYQALINEYHLTQEEVAFRVSKKRTSITNSLRLLKLHPSVQEMLQNNTISMGHAKVLLSLDTADQQLMVALIIAQDDLSVRQTEQKVHEILNPKQEKPKKSLPDQLIYQDLETRLGSSVNSKVVIHRSNAKKGKIEISYTSLEELERIAELLGVKM